MLKINLNKDNLESKTKKFNVWEWAPFYGLYEGPKNILKGNSILNKSDLLVAVNGLYHGAVSIFPVVYLITELVKR